MLHHLSSVRRLAHRAAASLIVLTALLPRALAAQGSVLVEGFAARRERASEPLFGGIAISSFRGPLGLRLGGAVHLREYDGPVHDCMPSAPCPANRSGLQLREWTADADIVVEPFRPVGVARALLLGFSPYAFAGIGGRGVRLEAWGMADTSLVTANLGAGVHHELVGRLIVGADARYRRALRSDSAITLGDRDHMEYRLALGLSFGGRHRMSSAGALARADAESCAGNCAPRAIERRVFAERTSSRVLDRADALVGRRRDAFDFVQHVFAEEGIALPSSPRRLADVGAPVRTSVGSLRPGDLLFFAGDGAVIDHVAIYAGGDRVVHASGGRVRYDVLGEGSRGTWLADHLVTARRVVTGEETRLRPRRPSF